MIFFDGKTAIKILKLKLFFRIIIPALFFGILVSVYFLSIKNFSVFPNKNNLQYNFYTDEGVGGDSSRRDEGSAEKRG